MSMLSGEKRKGSNEEHNQLEHSKSHLMDGPIQKKQWNASQFELR